MKEGAQDDKEKDDPGSSADERKLKSSIYRGTKEKSPGDKNTC